METKFMVLETPLGEISVLIDDVISACKITMLKKENRLCPDLTARYKIEVNYIPDGKEHFVTCCLSPSQNVKGYMESGERLECMGYYSEDEKIKMSIGLEADTGYTYDSCGNLVRMCNDYDYDGSFEEKSGKFYNSYRILSFTKTSKFIFGIAWMEDCNDLLDVQTWFGADPTLM